jgi:hypothetical protein
LPPPPTPSWRKLTTRNVGAVFNSFVNETIIYSCTVACQSQKVKRFAFKRPPTTCTRR